MHFRERNCPFDYFRFTAYLRIQNRRERQLRIEQRIQGKTAPWLSLGFYTDDILHEELALIYGELDTSSPIYCKMFYNYKEDRLQEISQWIQEEKKIIRDRFLSGQSLVDPTYHTPPESLYQLSDYFSAEELELFQDVKGRAQYFILPYVQEDSNSNRNTSTEQVRNDKRSNVVHNQLEKEKISDICVSPFGGPNLKMVTSEASGDAASCLYKNILHSLECVFALDLTMQQIPLRLVLKVCKDLFGFELSPQRINYWGYSNCVEFVTAIIKMFPSSQIRLLTSSDLCLKGDEHFVVSRRHEQKLLKSFKTNPDDQAMAIIKTQRPVDKKSLFSVVGTGGIANQVPRDCMQLGDRIDTASEWVDSPASNRRQKEILCVLTNFITPMDFHIVLRQNWEDFQKFQSALTSDYEAIEATSPGEILIHPSFELRCGHYLVVMRRKDNGKEYLRAQYVKEQYNGIHQIFLVDYGEFLNVQKSELRFLRKYIAHEMKAQAIWCGLDNVSAEIKWSQEEIDLTHDMISRKPFAAKFINKINFKGRNQWFVKAKGIWNNKSQDVGEVLKGMR